MAKFLLPPQKKSTHSSREDTQNSVTSAKTEIYKKRHFRGYSEFYLRVSTQNW